MLSEKQNKLEVIHRMIQFMDIFKIHHTHQTITQHVNR